MKHLIFLLTVIYLLTSYSSVYSSDGHSEHDDHSEHDSTEELVSRINAKIADQTGITISIASPQKLKQATKLYGNLVLGPEQLSHVRARFEGLIQTVSVSIGDYVKTGDLLARIESNDSLRTYPIRAPISGRIVQRHANTGEFTQNQVLFSIANLDTLWAELRVFPSRKPLVNEGQTVRITNNGNSIDSQIIHLVPSLDSPYQLARVKLQNTEQTLVPGLMVEGQVVTNEFSTDLAVLITAIQEIEGQQGVFIRNDEVYAFTPLVLGRRDRNFVEVLEGLNKGDEYVSGNSYLLKADLEKSEAEHDH